MPIPEGQEYRTLFNDANEIARSLGQGLNTVHLLLAFFSTPCKASVLLESYKVNADKIMALVDNLAPEPSQILLSLNERIKDCAQSTGASEIDSLHILVAIVKSNDCQAFKILKQAIPGLATVKVNALAYASNGLSAKLQNTLTHQRGLCQVTAYSRSGLSTMECSYEEILGSIPVSEYVRPPEEARLNNKKIQAKQRNLTTLPLIKPPVLPAQLLQQAHTAVMEEEQPVITPAAVSDNDLLPEKDYPTLSKLGHNLVEKARKGHIDDAFMRDRETEQLIDILGKRHHNNPILIGSPGVGKTAIVAGLALKIATHNEDVAHMHDKIIIELDMGALEAGTALRGAFSDRLNKIKEEVAAAHGRIIIFIDEIHTMMGAGSSGESALDAANELKTALASGDFPCIGATTEEEFKKYIEPDAAMMRRFTPIYVEEPNVQAAQAIIEASIKKYEKHHKVTYTPEAIEAACMLSSRYIPELHLPAKALDLLDEAGASKWRDRKNKTVDRADIVKLIHNRTNVPLERLQESEDTKLARAEEYIHGSFVGHDSVVRQVANAIRRGYAGFTTKRPLASMLFIGPTGVGKTELCHALAELLYGQKDAIMQLNMTEFTEAHSKSRLIGAPPGYSGSDRGGELTEALRRRPSQLVLFDEIEKAHRDVQALLLQILEEGQLSDSNGRAVSFRDSLVIMTSNLGFESGLSKSTGKKIGFGASSNKEDDEFDIDEEAIFERASKGMAPELWGRIDERLLFRPLTRELVGQIATLQLNEAASDLFREREINLTWDERVIGFLLDNGGYSPEVGARGMRQAINHHIKDLIAQEIINQKFPRKSVIKITLKNNHPFLEKLS